MAIVDQQPLGGSNRLAIVDADPTAGAGLAGTTGDLCIHLGNALYHKVGAGDTNWSRSSTFDDIADPGNGLAIPVVQSGACFMTSAGAETRTLAIPAFAGQQLTLVCDVYVGDIVVTAAAAVDVLGSVTLTFGNAGDTLQLIGTQVGGALVWRVVGNNGVALT